MHYFDLRRYRPDGEFFMNEGGIQAPGTLHRWMGSAAADWQGNLAVGYSASGIASYPSIRYAGRLAGDPPGRLTLEEAIMQPGETSQGPMSRWGDYSMLAVDPLDDCTFWYVNQYMANNSYYWKTRIGSFRFTNSAPSPKASVRFTALDAGTGLPLASAVVESLTGYYRALGSANDCLVSLAPGAHTFYATAPGYETSSPAQIVLTNGQAATQTFQLRRVLYDFTVSGGPAVHFDGPEGGPFLPAMVAFTLGNEGGASLSWTSYWNHAWMTAEPSGGILAPGESIQVAVRPASLAQALPPSVYSDTLVFVSLADSKYHTVQAGLSITTSPSRLSLLREYQVADKTNAFVDVEVVRSNGGKELAWVDYQTGDLTAQSGVDYQPASGSLFFPPGITNQTVRIELLNPARGPSKAFRISLSNPGGFAGLGDKTTAVIHLVENRNLVYRNFLDQDPQWDMETGWEFGKADPRFTGSNACGFYLAESYPNNLAVPYSLTTGAIDCSGFKNLKVHFNRVLVVERSLSDHADFLMSTNGTDWTTLWSNSRTAIHVEFNWTLASYSLSASADQASTLYLRWSFGPTDSSVAYTGWRVDDLEVFGEPAPVPTLTDLPSLTNRWELANVRMVDKDTNSLMINANELYLADLRLRFPEIKSVRELINKSDYYFYPASLADKFRASDRAVLQSGAPWEAIEENPIEGGVKSYVYVSKTPLRDAEGRIFAVRVLFYPAPGRPETALPAFTNEWAAARALVIDKDANSVFINANEAFLRTLRPAFPAIQSATNLIGRDDYCFYPASLADKFRADDQRVLSSGASWVTVEENQPLGGPKTWMQVIKSPRRNAGNEILGVRIVAFPVPLLGARPVSSGLEVSWPADFAPFALQHAASPGLPWNDLNTSIWITNEQIHTVIPTSAAHEYYRLRLDPGAW